MNIAVTSLTTLLFIGFLFLLMKILKEYLNLVTESKKEEVESGVIRPRLKKKQLFTPSNQILLVFLIFYGLYYLEAMKVDNLLVSSYPILNHYVMILFAFVGLLLCIASFYAHNRHFKQLIQSNRLEAKSLRYYYYFIIAIIIFFMIGLILPVLF